MIKLLSTAVIALSLMAAPLQAETACESLVKQMGMVSLEVLLENGYDLRDIGQMTEEEIFAVTTSNANLEQSGAITSLVLQLIAFECEL